jgi:hypothetical protein
MRPPGGDEMSDADHPGIILSLPVYGPTRAVMDADRWVEYLLTRGDVVSGTFARLDPDPDYALDVEFLGEFFKRANGTARVPVRGHQQPVHVPRLVRRAGVPAAMTLAEPLDGHGDVDLAPPESHDHEHEHTHTCPGCGVTRACTTMICRDPKFARPCWPCVRSGRALWPPAER